MSNTSQNSFAEGDIVEVLAEYFDYDDDLSAGESRVVFEGVWGFVIIRLLYPQPHGV